jgi:membrane protein DedA with SNARE-associated domain
MIESFFALLNHLETTFSPDNPYGLVILFFLAVITDIGIPVPFFLDTVLILTAFKTGPLSIQVILIVIMLFLGRQLGSGILYLLSRFLGKGFIRWLKCHIPSIGNGMDSFVTRMNHIAPLAVATGRLTPGLLQITSVASGAIRLRYSHFAIGIAISSLVYDFILILLGFIAAHHPRSGDTNFTIWLLISMIIIVCFLWPLIFLLSHRNGKKVACSPDNGSPVRGKATR